MGRVVHFELFDEQPQRLVDFYRAAFGWDISTWGGSEEYHLVGTGPREEVGIDGAIAPFGVAGGQPVVLTIDVADLGDAIAKVLAAGGEAVSDRGMIEGVGEHAYMRDPGGLVFGIMQAVENPTMGAGAEGERTSWDDVGERLRDLGASLARVVGESTSSPQAKRVREEAERAAASVREAGRQAADRARPHVISALDRVSTELDQLAARLRGSEQAVVDQTPPSEGADEGSADGNEEIRGPEEDRPLA